MGYQLGIDVGTTYTAAAVCRSSDRRWVEPEVVTLGTRNATVPSVLFVAPDGSVLVGEAAERRALTDPDRVVRQFKRRIGDPTPVVVAGRAWAPEELSARLLRWVADRVAEREGGPADRIAVTHPASWGQHKKDLFGAALAAQGLMVTFLAEPQAAALHYAAAERVAGGSTIAVYDLGGGTFDAAVVRKGDPSGGAAFTLLGRPQGLERLGGIDFDDAVFQHVLQGMPDAFADLDESDPAVLSAVARIRRECVEAKEALSSDTDVSIPVLLPATQSSVRLHRSEFEAMIRPQIEETVAALRGAVGSAGLSPEQLTAVLLVGGSSRIPLVAQLVSEQFGRPVAVDADPKNAIAKGAALAVSPMPTASWPGVSMPPVPPGPPVGRATAAPHQAPPRPPRPAAAPLTPPRGYARPPAAQPRPPVPAAAAAVRGREPATAVLPPRRPQPSWQDEPNRHNDREPRRRPSGLLIGLGGLLAAVVVVVVVYLLSPGSQSPGLGLDVAPATPTQAPPAGRQEAPAPQRGGNAGGAAEDDGDANGDGRNTPPPSRDPGGSSGPTTRPGVPGGDVVDPPVEPPVDTPVDPPTGTPVDPPTDTLVDPPLDTGNGDAAGTGDQGGTQDSNASGDDSGTPGTEQPGGSVVADEPATPPGTQPAV
jgi:molecular chaperone DnaK